MIIGVPKEIKVEEYRVALIPAGVREFTSLGHRVLIESGAGEGAGYADEDYRKVGAEVRERAADVWTDAELIVKVKEPQLSEATFLSPKQILFTYLHLAAERALTEVLMEKKVTAIGYETVQMTDGRLPILAPMSEVAGRMAPQVGACFLERPHGGRGILLGGVAGVGPGHVVILGAGNAGINAAYVAVGMGAKVTVIDISLDKLRFLEEVLYGKLTTMALNQTNLENTVLNADLVIGAVLIPGAKAPVLVTEEMVKAMKKGSVIIDISVDQGGCVETSQPTTHAKPIYVKHGVIHYGVTNMPGAVPFTSTLALTNVTLPYALKLAELGFERAVSEDPALAKGVNVYRGEITCQPVAEAHGLKFRSLDELLKG